MTLNLSIDAADNANAINGDKIEFSFNIMLFRLVVNHFYFFILSSLFRMLTDTISVKLEPNQPMSCFVSNSFEAINDISMKDESLASINATFELTSDDISLVSK